MSSIYMSWRHQCLWAIYKLETLMSSSSIETLMSSSSIKIYMSWRHQCLQVVYELETLILVIIIIIIVVCHIHNYYLLSLLQKSKNNHGKQLYDQHLIFWCNFYKVIFLNLFQLVYENSCTFSNKNMAFPIGRYTNNTISDSPKHGKSNGVFIFSK